MTQGTPAARLTEEAYRGVGNGLDLWSPLGNPRGNPHLTDDLLYDTAATKYPRRGEVFCFESHRVKNFAYANKAARDEWARKRHSGEVEADYTPDGEFYDAVAR